MDAAGPRPSAHRQSALVHRGLRRGTLHDRAGRDGGRFAVDRLWFSDQTGTYLTLPWDAPVSRVEGGVAWAATRHVIVRGTVQHNARTRGRVRRETLPAAQVTLWF